MKYKMKNLVDQIGDRIDRIGDQIRLDMRHMIGSMIRSTDILKNDRIADLIVCGTNDR